MKSVLRMAAWALMTTALLLGWNGAETVEMFSHPYSNRIMLGMLAPGTPVTEGEFVYARSTDLTIDGFQFTAEWESTDGKKGRTVELATVRGPGDWAVLFVNTGPVRSFTASARPFRFAGNDGAWQR